MAEVQNQHNSTKMRGVFVDCQNGHHSHASLIKGLMKVYNNVSFISITSFYVIDRFTIAEFLRFVRYVPNIVKRSM